MSDYENIPVRTASNASTERFCNFMLITARTEDAKRLFRQFAEHETAQLIAEHETAQLTGERGHMDGSAAERSATRREGSDS